MNMHACSPIDTQCKQYVQQAPAARDDMSSTSSTTSYRDLVDDVVWDILLRLSPESVLRSGAACKRWRRVTTCPAFLAAYSRRRPLEILAYPDGYKAPATADHNVLAAVNPLESADYVTGCRRLLRFDDGLVHLVDSRDGLLLFKAPEKEGSLLLICNPATRQWVGLPRLSTTPALADPCDRVVDVVPSGLYFHRSSGEHRVLCIVRLRHHSYTRQQYYYILSTGTAEPRRLGPVATTAAAYTNPSPCLPLGDTLYWLSHPESGTSGKTVAFDTVSETFRLIALPPPLVGGVGEHHLRLFDMDGTLAVSAVPRSRCMDIWVLQDDARWTRLLQVNLPGKVRPGPWPPIDEAVAVVEGGVLVVVGSGRVVLYDMKEKRTVSTVDHRGDIGNVTQFLYRASFVRLPGPDAQPLPFCPIAGGEPSLRYCPPDDPYMSLFRSDSPTWVISRAL